MRKFLRNNRLTSWAFDSYGVSNYGVVASCTLACLVIASAIIWVTFAVNSKICTDKAEIMELDHEYYHFSAGCMVSEKGADNWFPIDQYRKIKE